MAGELNVHNNNRYDPIAPWPKKNAPEERPGSAICRREMRQATAADATRRTAVLVVGRGAVKRHRFFSLLNLLYFCLPV